jgi:hypothetical protein
MSPTSGGGSFAGEFVCVQKNRTSSLAAHGASSDIGWGPLKGGIPGHRAERIQQSTANYCQLRGFAHRWATQEGMRKIAGRCETGDVFAGTSLRAHSRTDLDTSTRLRGGIGARFGRVDRRSRSNGEGCGGNRAVAVAAGHRDRFERFGGRDGDWACVPDGLLKHS